MPATYRLRGLCLLLPLPWAKTTIPRVLRHGQVPGQADDPGTGLDFLAPGRRVSMARGARGAGLCRDCGVAARSAPPPAPGRSGRRPGPWTRWRCRRRPPPRSARPAAGAAAGPGNAQPRASTAACSHARTAASSFSGTPAAWTIRRWMTRIPSSPTASMPSSGWNGTPSLRTMMTSSGAPSARATCDATGTSPGGRLSRTTGSPRRCRSLAASRRPASSRSAKVMTTPRDKLPAPPGRCR